MTVILALSCFFFFNDTATTEIYTLSLHDALPICLPDPRRDPGDADQRGRGLVAGKVVANDRPAQAVILAGGQGTRLRPLTLARAKPVVPLLNRPFPAYQLALLRGPSLTDVILPCSFRVEIG